MLKNVGGIDRIIRFVAGAVILVAGILAKSWWAVLGGVLLVTALINFCPLYLPFRISTCRVKTK